MPKRPAVSSTPELVLERKITFVLGGGVRVEGTLVSPDPLGEPGALHRRGVDIGLQQPKGAWTEAHILSQIQRMHPQCRVRWADPAPDAS